MWPMLLNMTHDECRRTLRRLELEAYSNMISVLRAQGALEETRKKLLEDLRAVLHISSDRHSAEARRVSNDELLATIAEQLAGPNTGLAWICEGRRRIPLLPRGVAQTMYTELADQAAEAAKAENLELQKRLEAEKLVAPKSNEEDMPDAEGETAESAIPPNDMSDEFLYPPIAMEDQTAKLWETELSSRKRKNTDPASDEVTTPVKNVRNIPVNTNQKHLNLSQIYSKFSQPATSKPSSQSKHSYNQVSKVSTSRSSQGHSQTTPHKPRAHKRSKNTAPIIVSKSQVKKPQEVPMATSPSKYNTVDFSGPPNTFQASYAQSVLGGKGKMDTQEDMKPRVEEAGPQASPASHELTVSATPHHPGLQAQPPSTPSHTISGKPSHLIIKSKGDITSDKKIQVLHKQPSENVKLISNKQVVVTPGSAHKTMHTPGKMVTTKVIGSMKQRTPAHSMQEKMIVVAKPPADGKGVPNSKIIITTPAKQTPVTTPRTSEAFTPKGIPATDLKVSAKTVVLNPKSGQKMVVLPAKARGKPGNDGLLPIVPVQFKGMTTSMKLVPVNSAAAAQITRPTPITVVSKPASVPITPKKIIGVEPIKTANLADIVPVKGVTPVTTPKITNPIVRPVSKGNVIVVPKGATLTKALTFTKNGNDMSKIIMGKNVNQLLQAKPDQGDAGKCPGNVIVLELNNEQSGRTTTMSEILEGRTSRASDEAPKMSQEITQDTPVLFDNQMTEETCNASSLDSTAESISDIVPLGGSKETQSSLSKDSEAAKDSSSVDWEMELETVSGKEKDEDSKLNALHLDLGMSSEDETDYMGHKAKSKHRSQESIRATPSGESSVYSSGSGSALSLATRTLLSQLQDDGSSSNDSSFALKPKEPRDKAECDALTKAKEKLTEKVAKSRQKRIDIYSTAITPSDINLDSFSYLDEEMMAGDDEEEDKGKHTLHDQLARLLEAPSNPPAAASVDNLPLNK